MQGYNTKNVNSIYCFLLNLLYNRNNYRLCFYFFIKQFMNYLFEQNSLFNDPKDILQNIRNYLAGRTIGITRDESLLEEILKILFCIKFNKNIEISDDSYKNAKVFRNIFSNVKESSKDFFNDEDELLLDPKSLDYVIKELIKIESNNKQNIDLVAKCYEIFIGNVIKGQDGQFFTPNVAVEFLVNAVNPKPTWKIIDTACGSSGFLSYLFLFFLKKYPENELLEFVKNNLYGIEKDSYLKKLGWVHLKLLTGVDPNIINGDSLAFKGEPSLDYLKNLKFDLVITNPPFGSKIKAVDKTTQKEFDLGYKWIENNKNFIKTDKLLNNTPPQMLFMERNIKLLKDGGLLATVIPESLISNKNYKQVVDFLFLNGKIRAIIGMPESLFKTSGKGGTHTKTCLLIFEKAKKSEENYKLFLAEARWCGHDSRANKIPKNDLPIILENYLKFRNNELKKFSLLGYSLEKKDIINNILAPRYYDIEFKHIEKKVIENAELITIKNLVENNILEISIGDEVGKLNYGTGEIPYVRTSDIANLEIKTDVKQKVNEENYKILKHKQDIKKGDILMVKDGTYLIGQVAIITELDLKILYQSHIYKIRVNENNLGLTPYNFLGLIISKFVQRQIKSKQLTQDIIDSLGSRIYELVIPIPKNRNTLDSIDYRIREIINLKEKCKILQKDFLDFIGNELS